jgi:hypothetical protein
MTESKNHRLLACTFALLLLSAVPMLRVLGVPQSAQDDQFIKAIPELVGTRYCYGDAEVYSVWLKLRMKYVNRTHKTLILDKEIGKAWYREKVARNLDELAAGKYEYNPNIDWFFSDKDKLPDKPKSDSPSSDFVVLAPGETFVSEINTGIYVFSLGVLVRCRWRHVELEREPNRVARPKYQSLGPAVGFFGTCG